MSMSVSPHSGNSPVPPQKNYNSKGIDKRVKKTLDRLAVQKTFDRPAVEKMLDQLSRRCGRRLAPQGFVFYYPHGPEDWKGRVEAGKALSGLTPEEKLEFFMDRRIQLGY